jgi:16S rRNA (uracil1498-N3)-methyltransferase
MAYVPHLYIPGPWEGNSLSLDDDHRHHLRRVLRVADRSPVTYTDGQGGLGRGQVIGDAVRRGREERVRRPDPAVTVAVAPPHEPARARFIVEKLAELGIDRLAWLSTEHGRGRPPRMEKARRWALGALQQSRGTWVMDIEAWTDLSGNRQPVWIVHPGGGNLPVAAGPLTLAIGPEGGFTQKELAHGDATVGLGARVLRVETAAVVASGLVLHRLGRMNT